MRTEIVIAAMLGVSIVASFAINFVMAPPYVTYPFAGSVVTRDGITAEVLETAPSGLDNPSIRNIADVIVEMLENADNSIDAEIYTIYQSDSGPTADIQKAILDAANRGVRIRILIDNEIYTDTYRNDSKTRAMFNDWENHENIDIKTSPWLMHSKVIVVDNEVAITSSANQSYTAMTSNREIAVVLSGGDIALAYAAIFDSGWGGGEEFPEFESGWTVDWIKPVATPLGTPDWVPQTLDVVKEIVNGATETVRVPIYVLTGYPVSLPNAIENAAKHGAEVKVIVDTYYLNESRELLSSLAEDPNIQVKYANLGFSTYHVKSVVADGERAYVGSANWSNTSMSSRRELGVYFEDTTLASALETMFKADWESKYVRWIVEPASPFLNIALYAGGIFGGLFIVFLIRRYVRGGKEREEQKKFVAELWAAPTHEI